MLHDREREEKVRQSLLQHLEATHKAYREYRAQEKAALAVREDLGYTNPDGQFGVRMAVQAQNHAFEAYRRVLQEWTEFVLEGRIPAWADRDPKR